jgi:cold shock CspA family protein
MSQSRQNFDPGDNGVIRDSSGGADCAAEVAPAFYRGVIAKLDRAKGWGVIRSPSGRELIFQFPLVTVIGARPGSRMPGIELLAEGEEVGFDVTRTANGTRVTTIKPARRY